MSVSLKPGDFARALVIAAAMVGATEWVRADGRPEPPAMAEYLTTWGEVYARAGLILSYGVRPGTRVMVMQIHSPLIADAKAWAPDLCAALADHAPEHKPWQLHVFTTITWPEQPPHTACGF